MHLLYLPSYSPNLNPIEEAFSSIKAWLQANRDYVLGEVEDYDCNLYVLIWEAVYGVVTPDKIYGWYQHSKYIA
jgi:DDE superfamily endonuclease